MTSDQVTTVWWASPADAELVPEHWLDAVERGRRDAYVRRADAQRFVVGAALVRAVAATLLGVDPAAVPVDRTCASCGRPHGRVHVAGSARAWSVTHADDVVGLAVGSGLVGLDVEPVGSGPVLAETASSFLTGGELLRLDADRHLAWWTRKEAVVKATGDGIGIGLDALELAVHGDRVVSYPGPAADDPRLAALRLVELRPSAGHLAALAHAGDRDVELRDGSALLRQA